MHLGIACNCMVLFDHWQLWIRSCPLSDSPWRMEDLARLMFANLNEEDYITLVLHEDIKKDGETQNLQLTQVSRKRNAHAIEAMLTANRRDQKLYLDPII
eukprot:2377343-Amphidinium_carterae.1